MKTLIQEIKGRIAYEKKYRRGQYESGFSGLESGECCEKCKMPKDERNPLRQIAGCRDPFQINCKCHIPFRKVAVEVRIYTLEEILKLIEKD